MMRPVYRADLRNDLAKARDAWMASDEGTRVIQGNAGGQYLASRLGVAFIAGWKAHELNERKRVNEVLDKACGEMCRKDETAGSDWISRSVACHRLREMKLP